MSDPLSFLAAFSSEEVMDHVLPQTTTFFSLPLELRTQIYRLCLLPKQENTQTRKQAVTVKTHMKSRVGLNLLLGCKEIYVEAVQYAYEYRWWQIGNVPVQSPQRPLDGSTPIFDGPALMASINSQTMAKIKNLSFRIPITMHGGFAASPVVLGALDSMEGLSNVRACLYFRDSSWGYATKLADSPLLIGLMIQVLTQVPEHVMLSFEVRMLKPSARRGVYPYSHSDTALEAIRTLVTDYASLQGRNCGPPKPLSSLKSDSPACATILRGSVSGNESQAVRISMNSIPWKSTDLELI